MEGDKSRWKKEEGRKGKEMEGEGRRKNVSMIESTTTFTALLYIHLDGSIQRKKRINSSVPTLVLRLFWPSQPSVAGGVPSQ